MSKKKKKKDKSKLRKYWRLVYPNDYADKIVAKDENETKSKK